MKVLTLRLMSAFGTKQTSIPRMNESAFGGKADISDLATLFRDAGWHQRMSEVKLGSVSVCGRAMPSGSRLLCVGDSEENNAERTEDVAKLAPEAGYLLTMAFPSLTLPQADDILTQTEGPGGGFLDNGSAFGVYSRLDLYKAAEKASAFLRGTPHEVSSK
jgi:hypothetical protein